MISWYFDTGRTPQLVKAGGFRLDDPEGKVGIEFMIVTESSGDRAATYHVPLTYRGDPRGNSHEGLIGTSHHGVLGRRWIYDGIHDPTMVAQLVALIQGTTEPQAQNQTNTPDPTVVSHQVSSAPLVVVNHTVTTNGPNNTDLEVHVTSHAAIAFPQVTLRVHRVLQADDPAVATAAIPSGVSGTWRLLEGTEVRSMFITSWPSAKC